MFRGELQTDRVKKQGKDLYRTGLPLKTKYVIYQLTNTPMIRKYHLLLWILFCLPAATGYAQTFDLGEINGAM